MKFVCAFYILIVIFTEDKEKFVVQCIGELEENELVHLSQKLNALECLKLIQAVYELIPARTEREAKKHKMLSKDLSMMPASSKECLLNLEQWNNDFPKNIKPNERATMEMTLRWLGRPDLAKYVRESRGSIKFLDNEEYDIADTLEFPGHRILRRHTSEKDKHLSVHENKQKKKKKKKKRGHCDSCKEQNTDIQKGIAAAKAYEYSHNNHPLKKKDNHHPNKKDKYVGHRSICCSILFVLFFITVCLVAVYFFYKRNRSKARGTRFKYDWNANKKDKDTFTDNLEWSDEAICFCSDIEGGCTGKCPKCSGNDETHYLANDRTCSNQLTNLDCSRKLKKKRRHRFNFLQRNSQNKKREKDQENRDRKKTLERSFLKKREKMSTISQKDQCACCRCTLSSRDNKVTREKKENEKRELHRWKMRERKEEKRRRKDELRKAEKLASVCFKDTCK
ncbi:hypothetical protein ANTPLA_LOCUS3926 [Anthophora plagiata]